MNKILPISIGAIIIGFIALAFWFTSPASPPLVTNGGQNTGVSADTVKQSTTIVPTQKTTISIAGTEGVAIQTKDFVKDSATVKDPINSGYYYLGYHVYQGVSNPTITENPPYDIEYINATQYFNISLLKEPIGKVREEMQQYLITHLGISQDQMCQLNYMVSVPSRINAMYTGENLGFSFCSDATLLPK